MDINKVLEYNNKLYNDVIDNNELLTVLDDVNIKLKKINQEFEELHNKYSYKRDLESLRKRLMMSLDLYQCSSCDES